MNRAELQLAMRERGYSEFDRCECGEKNILVFTIQGAADQKFYTRKCGACDPEMAAMVLRRREIIEQEEIELRRQAKLAEMESEIGPDFARCTVETYIPATESQRQAAELVAGQWWTPKPFALLCGRPGTGKTHLGIAAYRVAASNNGLWNVDPVFTTENAFITAWRNAAANRTHFDELESTMECPALVLDDIGTIRQTDGAAELLFTLIDHRYRRRMPTFYTSNFGMEELDRRIGEKLLSRIVDHRISNVIMVVGENYRFKATQ